MVLQITFSKQGTPRLQLDAALRPRRGRVDPVSHLLAKTNRLILSGQVTNGIAFLEAAVLEVMQADAMNEQSFPLLIRLIMLYEKSGIIREICEKDLDPLQQRTLFALLDQAFFLADELDGAELPLRISSQLRCEVDDLGHRTNGPFPRSQYITLGEFLEVVEGLRQVAEAAKVPLELENISSFSELIAEAFTLERENLSTSELVNRLLEIEVEALKNLEASREDALQFLPDEVKEEYVDFLFMLGDAYIIIGEFQPAIDIFESLTSMPSEANIPDVLNNLAIAQTCEAERALLNGSGGRELYKQALANFEQAKAKGEASKEDAFEAVVYEARARVGAALLESSEVPKEDLFALLSPAMVGSREFAAEGRVASMYAQGMDKSLQILDARLAAEGKLETMVYILGQVGQQVGPAQLEDIEAIPVLVRIFLEPVASLVNQQNLVEVAKQLGQVNSGVGKRLSSLVLFGAVQNRIGKKELRAQDEVKRLLGVLKKGRNGKLFFQALVVAMVAYQRTVFAELREDRKEQEAAQAKKADQAAAAASIAEAEKAASQFMEKLSAAKKVSHTECRDFIGRLKVLGDQGAEIREQALAAIEQVIRGSSTVEGVLILAGLFYQEATDLQDKIKALFTDILEDKTCQDRIFKVIATIITNLMISVDRAARGEVSGQRMVAAGLPKKKVAVAVEKARPVMENDVNIENEIVVGFICVGLRELAIVKERYRKISGVPYSYPVNYLSIWYRLLAPHAKGKERQKVLLKALAHDPENRVAHLELARCTGELGQVEAADALVEEILEKTTDPVLVVRASLLRVLNILILLRIPKNKARASQLLGQAQQVLARADQAYQEVGDVTFGRVSLKHDWEGMLRVMGLMYDALNRFEPAMGYFDMALASNPGYKQIIVAKAQTLFKQCRFTSAVEFLSGVIERETEENHDYYLNLVEAYIRMGKFNEAQEYIEKMLTKNSKYINFQLADAFSAAVAANNLGADIAPAEKKLATCQEELPTLLPDVSSKILKSELIGRLALVEGEVLAAQGKRREALVKLKEAQSHFFGSQFAEYGAMLASWRAADLTCRWAMQDRKAKPGPARALYSQAAQQARMILETNPSFSLARETLIGALIDLEREAEALLEFRYLIDTKARITIESIMSLIVLAFASNMVRAEAKELVFELREKVPAGDFAKARAVVEKGSPGLDLSALG